MAKQRIGIFGGTFDPVHAGHMVLACSALDSARLDRLYVVPTGLPPYKPVIAPAEDRWRMLCAAFSGDKMVFPCRLEIDRPGPTYSADTIEDILLMHPEADLFFIAGDDVLSRVSEWRRIKEISRRCTFLVFYRKDPVHPGFIAPDEKEMKKQGIRIIRMDAVPPAVSSGSIRAALSAGEEPDMLNPAVLEYCACKGLYGSHIRIREASAWVDQLFDSLKHRRFAHSLSVARTSRALAVRYGEDPLRAEQAGLLHDCAKCLPLEEMQTLARRHDVTGDPDMLSSAALLHSVVGAVVAEHQYGMKDPEVLSAIAYHNTGFPGMSRLAMCVCLADYIEPLRESFPFLEKVRAESETSLERALLMSLEGTASYVLSRKQFLHPRTRDAIAWLKTLPACNRPPAADR